MVFGSIAPQTPFLNHAKPVLDKELPGCTFHVRPVKLQAEQMGWLHTSMISVKNALRKSMKSPKTLKVRQEPRNIAPKEIQWVSDDFFAIAITAGGCTQYFCQEDGSSKKLLMTKDIHQAKWYDSEVVAEEQAKNLMEQHNVKIDVTPVKLS